MDSNTSFQERVLSRLYGETKPESPEQDDPISDSDVTDVKVNTMKRKVYTVSQAPSDWCEKSTVNVNASVERETSPLSNTPSSSEDSEADDTSPPMHKRRKRRGKRFKMDPKYSNNMKDSETLSHGHSVEHTKQIVKDSMEDELKPKLTKNQKRKLKKKKRNEKVKQNSVNQGISGEFVYSCVEQVNKTDK